MAMSTEEILVDVKAWLADLAGCAVVELKRRMLDSRVQVWPLAANMDHDALARRVVATAQRDAKTQATQEVGFVLLGYKSSEPQPGELYVASFALDLAGKGARPAGYAGELEQATLAGNLGQFMRLLENMHRMVLQSTESREQTSQHTIDRLLKKIDEQDIVIRNNDKRRMEIVELAEDLARDKLAREMAQREMVLKEKQQDWLSDRLDNLVPILMNRALGGGPGKGASLMGQPLLMRLFAKMTGPQLDALQTIGLDPDQLAIIGELYMSYEKEWAKLQPKNKKHVEHASAPPDPSTNGAASNEGAAS
jgi:hypothetical protein